MSSDSPLKLVETVTFPNNVLTQLKNPLPEGKKTYFHTVSEDTLLKDAEQQGIESFVVGMIVRNSDNKLLILQRKHTDFMGSLWELPSGKVEEQETLHEAVHRELKEETGIKNLEILEYYGSFDYVSQSGKKTRQFNFLMGFYIVKGKIIHPEHESYKWLKFDSLTTSGLSQNVIQVLRPLHS